MSGNDEQIGINGKYSHVSHRSIKTWVHKMCTEKSTLYNYKFINGKLKEPGRFCNLYKFIMILIWEKYHLFLQRNFVEKCTTTVFFLTVDLLYCCLNIGQN